MRRRGSMPKRTSTSSMKSGSRSRFLSDSGSIGGIKQILRNRKLPRKFGRRKNGAVIARDERLEEIPHRPGWGAKDRCGSARSTFACPRGLFARGTRFDKGRGLRIVNHHKTSVQRQPFAIAAVVIQENFEIARADGVGVPVQSIVKRLGDVIELGTALHDVPAGVQSQLARQREQAGQNFRHAASHGGGIHHIDRLPSSGPASVRSSSISAAPKSGTY